VMVASVVTSGNYLLNIEMYNIQMKSC